MSTRLTIKGLDMLQPSPIWAGDVPDFGAVCAVRPPHFERDKRLENYVLMLRPTMHSHPASLSLPRLSFLHRTAELV